MRGLLAIAVALGAAACGSAESKKAPEPAPAKPVTPDCVPIARPSRVPAYVTLDELTPKHPKLAATRTVAPLALDESGKQALITECVTGTDAAAVAKTVIDQYAASRKPPTVQKTGFAADFDIADGAIHVQGEVRKDAACRDDELAVALSYTKMVPLVRGAGPPTEAPNDRGPPAPPR